MREVFETCVEYLKLNYSRNSERLSRTPVDEKEKRADRGRAGGREGGGGGGGIPKDDCDHFRWR